MEIAVGAGADDYSDNGEVWMVTTPPEAMLGIVDALEAAKIPVKESNLVFIPKALKPVTGDDAARLLKLVDTLDDHDDVANVYADFDVSDEDMAKHS
jgi:transcriptional/translational regulatory protein YebC/TACO1